MGLLIGLPLRLLGLIFALLRLALPVVVVLAVVWLWKRRREGAPTREEQEELHENPHFHGPVYTVDYEDVDESKDGEEQ